MSPLSAHRIQYTWIEESQVTVIFIIIWLVVVVVVVGQSVGRVNAPLWPVCQFRWFNAGRPWWWTVAARDRDVVDVQDDFYLLFLMIRPVMTVHTLISCWCIIRVQSLLSVSIASFEKDGGKWEKMETLDVVTNREANRKQFVIVHRHDSPIYMSLVKKS